MTDGVRRKCESTARRCVARPVLGGWRGVPVRLTAAALLAGVMSVTGVVTAAATVTKSATASSKAVGFGARPGYSSGWLAFASGTVVAYGGAPNLGSAPAGWGLVTGIAATPDGGGYWLVTGSGQARGFGDARAYPGPGLRAKVVGISASSDGRGYLLLTSDGRVYSRGDAVARGGAPGQRGPFTAIVPTPDHKGYWLLSATGRVYGFGNAPTWPVKGANNTSLGAATALGATPDGRGYWEVTQSGVILSFGDAPQFATKGPKNAVAVIPSPTGSGFAELLINGVFFGVGNSLQFAPTAVTAPTTTSGATSSSGTTTTSATPVVGVPTPPPPTSPTTTSTTPVSGTVSTTTAAPTTTTTAAPTTTTTAAPTTTTTAAPTTTTTAAPTTTTTAAPTTTTTAAPTTTTTAAPTTSTTAAPTTTTTAAPTTTTTAAPTTTTTAAPTTTTTVAPTTTTTAAPTTTTTVAPTTTTTAAPTTTTTAPTTTTSPTTTTTVAPTTTTTAAPSTTTTTAVAPTTTTGQSDTDVPPASLLPDSLFNSNVASWSLNANSAEYVGDVVNDYETEFGSVGVNSMPVYTVPADEPEATISVSPNCTNFTSDTGTEVPIPSYASLNGSSDSPLVVFQPSTDSAWELWQLTRDSSTSYSACWGGKLDTATTNGVFPDPYGLSATGISYLATIVTEEDVASGTIDHAIAVSLPRCNHSVYPAARTDCGSDPGQPGEGQWFRFPPSLPMPSGLNPFAQMVFKAIQAYGMVVTDQSGGVEMEDEQQSDWTAEGNTGPNPIATSWDGLEGYQVVAGLPWSSLQAVDPPQD